MKNKAEFIRFTILITSLILFFFLHSFTPANSLFEEPETKNMQVEHDNPKPLSFNPKMPELPVDRTMDTIFPKKVLIRKNTKVTSYNAEVGQTDSTPCVAGGTGYNICAMAKEGKRPIALSQELIQWSMYGGLNAPFKKGDILIMESELDDLRCNGEFIVSDAMNSRYRNRADIFFMNRKDNISCTANIYLLTN